jgi:hypothetical protein
LGTVPITQQYCIILLKITNFRNIESPTNLKGDNY